MAADTEPGPAIREAVASFAGKEAFRDAIAALIAAGFAPDDLSVLATHESLEIAGRVPGYPGTPRQSATASLTDELNFLAPITVAGIVLLSGGPVAAALAALVGAGLSGMALNEVMQRYTANRHSAEFAKALAEGAVLLWVRVDTPEREATALGILEKSSGRNAHTHLRSRGATRD